MAVKFVCESVTVLGCDTVTVMEREISEAITSCVHQHYLCLGVIFNQHFLILCKLLRLWASPSQSAFILNSLAELIQLVTRPATFFNVHQQNIIFAHPNCSSSKLICPVNTEKEEIKCDFVQSDCAIP